MDRYKNIFETFDRIAQEYQDKFMDLDLYDDTFDQYCSLLEKPSPKILEIGCGPGNITRYLLSKRPDFEILATDVAPGMITLATNNNPGADFRVMDCREINRLTGKFDGIMCGFCMPYLSKEECGKLIHHCAGLLHNGGILYFSTMEGDYATSGDQTSSNGQSTMYICFHQEDYLRDMLRENGFEIAAFTRKYYPKADGTFQPDMVFIAVK